ncbi:hypothetical protein [Nocardioides sp.]|uniref:hypothetical protein n=1 Tax=Nocardioides sp. TaxID=35761 RepID=UPI0031FEDFAF|nr:hypothetical protein [Nocardioides sp.]
MSDEPVERFRPTSGRITGGIGLAVALAIVVIGIVDRGAIPGPVLTGALVVGVLVWASTLRPRVSVTEDHLVLRNMLDTVSIPLASIEEIAVRQVLAVRAGADRYVSPAVGRSWRQTIKSNKRNTAVPVDAALASYPDFVEQRIRQRCDDERAKRGIQSYSDEQAALAEGVRRQLAWPEIAALAVATLAFVISLLV